MDLSEKAAYIKGLVEGLGVDESTKEGKILKEISAYLCELSDAVREMDEDLTAAYDEINDLSDELENLEADLYGDEEDDEDTADEENEPFYEVPCPNCGETVYVSEGDLDAGEAICPSCKATFEVALADEDEEGGEAEDDGPARYEVTCPSCGEATEFDEDTLLDGEAKCPHCGAQLNFDAEEK